MEEAEKDRIVRHKEESREKVWICGACGKTAETPYDFRDVSCSMNCIQVYKDSIQKNVEVDGDFYQTYIPEDGVVDPQPDWSKD